MPLKDAMELPSQQSEKSLFFVRYDTLISSMLLKSPLEEIFMTHLYSPHNRSLTYVDIGDGILRAGSYSSWFCPLVG